MPKTNVLPRAPGTHKGMSLLVLGLTLATLAGIAGWTSVGRAPLPPTMVLTVRLFFIVMLAAIWMPAGFSIGIKAIGCILRPPGHEITEFKMSTNINDNLQVQAGECLWTAPPGVKDHQGSTLLSDADFFVRPPREIGEIKSAHTSLKKGVKARPMQVQLGIAALWGFGGFLLAMGLNRLTGILTVPADMTGTPDMLWAAIFGLLPGYIAWRKTAFKHFCQFVGVDGCAQISCQGQRENITGNSVFCFKDAAAISTSTTRHNRDGSYRYTSYYFYWCPAESEKPVFALSGTHAANLQTPPAGNTYNFLRAAESAWYDYLIPKADAELAQNGYLKFHMGHNRYARVGKSFIEIVEADGAANRCEAGDIGSAKLASGNFTLTRKDATSTFFGLLGSSGTFHFDYSNMYNGRLFLFAFQKFLNIKVG